MSATTVNSFPSLHNWNSPRAWALAIIVLLHLGFFWALTNGMTQTLMKVFVPEPPKYLPLPDQPTPTKPYEPKDPLIQAQQPKPTYVLPPIDVFVEPTDSGLIVNDEPTVPDDFVGPGSATEPLPKVVEPRIDSRRGLTEPYYPPAEIRAGAEGTVVLSIYILADGRVGEVRLITSSGHEGLDKSAMREAKKWRFVAGTSDGQPMAMWKQLPVTFRLNTRM
jgi:protein TonB